MFYLREIAALAICWLFYCELYWMLERKVRKVCSREFIRKHLQTLFDKIFFTPISGKANLGTMYYVNVLLFWLLLGVTLFHLMFGWIGALQGFIRVVTTLLVLVLGAIAASCSAGSVEYICINRSITNKSHVLALQIVSFVSELLLMLVYLYFAWAFIG